MGNMRFKVGDRVRIKSLDWYNENKTIHGDIWFDNAVFVGGQSLYCGCELTICLVTDDSYHVIENDYYWTDEMIEGLVEEETEKKVSDESWRYKNIFDHSQYPQSFECPEGYIFKDEHGNVINTNKIVLEKKKNGYPKTYEECSLINGAEGRISLGIIGKFTKLINARNAYWKIAGEEMGLGKSWEPDYKNPDIDLYVIINIYNRVEKAKYGYGFPSCVFTFPTEKMRDAFYENFKEEIESCKELL